MQKYICSLLILGLGTISTCITTPCHAQTAAKSESQNTDQISSVSSNSTSTAELPGSIDSADNKATVVSETVSDSSAPKANTTATQPELRIPIFSRIFPTTSMQQ
ncbi:MAG: hypothetical protein RMX96_21530 [Nostoc sp. ChiSLP02]|nr:hypothetical protein [Nostoc sp. DedSLP05]MDZ8097219.1 hypothetical protein [Nostoc sp. DedSLP01]MDZ8187415.1 hypothetical protein [Nostoc sp. ChiSLP02]